MWIIVLLLLVPGPCDPEDLLDGIIFGAKYLGSTQLQTDRNPSTNARMAQAQEAVDRIKVKYIICHSNCMQFLFQSFWCFMSDSVCFCSPFIDSFSFHFFLVRVIVATHHQVRISCPLCLSLYPSVQNIYPPVWWYKHESDHSSLAQGAPVPSTLLSKIYLLLTIHDLHRSLNISLFLTIDVSPSFPVWALKSLNSTMESVGGNLSRIAIWCICTSNSQNFPFWNLRLHRSNPLIHQGKTPSCDPFGLGLVSIPTPTWVFCGNSRRGRRSPGQEVLELILYLDYILCHTFPSPMLTSAVIFHVPEVNFHCISLIHLRLSIIYSTCCMTGITHDLYPYSYGGWDYIMASCCHFSLNLTELDMDWIPVTLLLAENTVLFCTFNEGLYYCFFVLCSTVLYKNRFKSTQLLLYVWNRHLKENLSQWQR